jgi:hypothetical protein
MTQDIIAMAREAGINSPDFYKLTVGHMSIETLERFADLVRADERDRATRENAYVLAEREACAVLCDQLSDSSRDLRFGAAVRART